MAKKPTTHGILYLKNKEEKEYSMADLGHHEDDESAIARANEIYSIRPDCLVVKIIGETKVDAKIIPVKSKD